MNLIHTLVLAIIEGLTEFLPVSSTGHMVIASTFMGIATDPFVKVFTIVIQLGTILSVVVLYWRNFLQNIEFYLRLAVAFLPAVVFGLLFKKQIDGLLENIVVVAIALLAGGIIFLFIDEYFEKNERRQTDISDINYMKAFKIGMFQVISMIPGVSRAAATLIGGLSQGLNRKTAAEFSFFLAVPTMLGASVKSLYDYFKDGAPAFNEHQWTLLLVGNVVAFIVGMFAIKSFIQYLTKNGLKVFGYYRIALGLVILALWALGHFDHVDLSKF